MVVTLLVIAAVLLALGLLYLLCPELFIIPILMILYLVNPGQKPHPPWEDMSDRPQQENSDV
jgi:hypothetical protein